MITRIGIISGEILAVLETALGPVRTDDLAAYLKEPGDEVLMSIGWLVREGYVQVESVDGASFISLNDDRSPQAARLRLSDSANSDKSPAETKGAAGAAAVESLGKKISAGTARMYQDFIESIPVGIYMADAVGHLFYVNGAFVEMLGYQDKKEFSGLNLSELYVNPQDREMFLKTIDQKGSVSDYETKALRKDGKIVVLSETARLLKNSEGQVIGLEGVVRNITEKRRAEEQLRIENMKLEHILSIHEEISSILKLDELIDFVIAKAVEVLDVKRCSLMLLDNNTRELCIKGSQGLSEDIVQETRVKLGEQISGMVALYGTPMLVADMDSERPVARKSRAAYSGRSFLSVPIKLEKKIIGVVNVADKGSSRNEIFTQTDLRVLNAIVRQAAVAIENANLYRELKYLSVTDSLTGLYNHRHFVKTLDHEIKRLKRYHGSLCLMMIDVDNFKTYNDTYGHQEGDMVIREVAQALVKNLREIDIPCRYGGDEFAVILLETKTHKAEIVAKKFQKAMENLDFKRKITLSIGIAAYGNNLDRHELILKADQALYQSKKEGRDKISVYA